MGRHYSVVSILSRCLLKMKSTWHKVCKRQLKQHLYVEKLEENKNISDLQGTPHVRGDNKIIMCGKTRFETNLSLETNQNWWCAQTLKRLLRQVWLHRDFVAIYLWSNGYVDFSLAYNREVAIKVVHIRVLYLMYLHPF